MTVQTSENTQSKEQAPQPAETATSLLESAEAAPSGEEQPAGEAEPEAAEPAPESKPEEPKGAPESYEFKAPEGLEFGDALLTEYGAVAKELNLTQADAQKVLDRVGPALAAQNAETVAAIRNEWTAASKADKEFGGSKLNANLGIAKKALDAFGTPELRTLLDTTGLGNHPEVLRLLYRAGQKLSSDTFVSSSGQAVERDPAKVLFPDMN